MLLKICDGCIFNFIYYLFSIVINIYLFIIIILLLNLNLYYKKKFTMQANALACQGKYEAGSIPSLQSNTSLFVKAHAY